MWLEFKCFGSSTDEDMMKNTICDTKIDISDERTHHEKRVERLSAHKNRTLWMSYLVSAKQTLNPNQLYRYRNCHNYLLFRYYPHLQKKKLHETKHCDIHLLCPMCAIRRAARQVQRYEEKVNILLKNSPKLKLYYVVLTIKNQENLLSAFQHLIKSYSLLSARRRQALHYKKTQNLSSAYAKDSVFSNVVAGAYSIEIKRGKNSGLWHPHMNLLLLTEDEISQESISKEWESITQDSYIVYCEETSKNQKVKDALVEIFKYALKYSEMEADDTFLTYQTLRSKRLFGSFGEFRGLDIDIDDNDTYEHLEYVELFYSYATKSRKYILTTTNGELETAI